MRRVIKIFGGICLFVCAVLLTAEGLLRLQERYLEEPMAAATQHEMRTVLARIHRLWFRGEEMHPDPFLPPYEVFSNTDIDDAERLASIREVTRLSPSGTWTSYDFLQHESKAPVTTYVVESNTQGFRSREYSSTKPGSTYRIVVLGSYHAFGHGVDNDETYASVLESELNMEKEGVRYEVWNGGRHADTAIGGLARMDEVLSYDPDMLILDYGIIDTMVYGDNTFLLAMHVPEELASHAMRTLIGPVLYALDHSLLFNRVFQVMIDNKNKPQRVAQFSQTMDRIISRARESGIPVILVRQLYTLPLPVYEALGRPGVSLVDVDSLLMQASSTPPGPDEWRTGYYATTWLGELDPALVQSSPGMFKHYPFRLNIYQLNAYGHREIGHALTPVVRSLRAHSAP